MASKGVYDSCRARFPSLGFLPSIRPLWQGTPLKVGTATGGWDTRKRIRQVPKVCSFELFIGELSLRACVSKICLRQVGFPYSKIWTGPNGQAEGSCEDANEKGMCLPNSGTANCCQLLNKNGSVLCGFLFAFKFI